MRIYFGFFALSALLWFQGPEVGPDGSYSFVEGLFALAGMAFPLLVATFPAVLLGYGIGLLFRDRAPQAVEDPVGRQYLYDEQSGQWFVYAARIEQWVPLNPA